ncbi:MAG: hypothetical protein AB7K52_15025 [Phycisphaerales bacterium]
MRRTCLAVASLLVCAGLPAAASADLARLESNANLADGILTNLPGLMSHRDLDPGSLAIAAGDTYAAGVLGQTTTQAAFMTAAAGRVTTHTYDLMSSLHGTLVGSNAMVNITESQTLVAPGHLRVAISALTADGSTLWISGLNIGGNPITQARFDVGAGISTNGLLWDNVPDPILSVTITNALFADGMLVATSAALINGRTLPEMGAVVVWNGVVGSTIDETQMVFDIMFVPAPGAAAVGMMAGVALIRRRR